MRTLPEGIVTFLFTDVEGSTRLAKEFGDSRWAELLDAHRGILRRAFSAHEGREVATQGDAFFVVFTRATDAVLAAIDGQRALEEHPWPDGRRVRVRIGLHTGEALARDDNYVGQEVHRASRICDAGHGGQIVVSQTTADLVRESLPRGGTLTDLGHHPSATIGRICSHASPRAYSPSGGWEARTRGDVDGSSRPCETASGSQGTSAWPARDQPRGPASRSGVVDRPRREAIASQDPAGDRRGTSETGRGRSTLPRPAMRRIEATGLRRGTDQALELLAHQ